MLPPPIHSLRWLVGGALPSHGSAPGPSATLPPGSARRLWRIIVIADAVQPHRSSGAARSERWLLSPQRVFPLPRCCSRLGRAWPVVCCRLLQGNLLLRKWTGRWRGRVK